MLSAALRVLAAPNRGRFLAVARLSRGRWLGSLTVYVLGATSWSAITGLATGLPLWFLDLLPTAFLLGILALAWAAAAEISARRILGKGDDLFEPLPFLSSTSLLLLMYLSLLLSFLPGRLAQLSALPLAYTQVLVVLAIRAFRGTSLPKALLVAVTAAILGFVIAFMGWQLLGGMPGFFERGYL
jgi:hypothetical protein